MLSLIVPLALGYLAVRAVASGLAGAAETGRLDVLLSAPVSRSRLVAAGFLATAVELAGCSYSPRPDRCSAASSPAPASPLGSALAGFANVWPLALLFAGLGIVATGCSLRTRVVTGSVAGVLVAMYVIDLVGRLDPASPESATPRYSATTATRSRTASTRSRSPGSPARLGRSPHWAPLLFERRDIST